MCLTGGSSALPRLDDLVADRFGGLTAEDGRRKLAVVLGAAAGPVPVATTSATAVTPSEVAAGAPAGAGAAAEPQGQAPATPPTAKVVSAAMTRQDPPPPPIAGVGAVAAIAPQPPAPGPTGEPPGAIAQTPRIPARGPRTPASQSTTGPGSSGRERLLPAALVLGSGIVALAILALPWLPGLSDESGIGLIGILWDPSLRGAYPLVVTALAGLSLVVVGAAWVIGQRSTRPGSVLAIAAGAALVIAPIELILRFEDWTETVGPPPLFAIVAGVVALAGAAVAARQTRLDQRWPAVLVAAGGLAGLIGLGAALVVDDRGLSPMDLASDFLRLLGPVPPVCALASLVLDRGGYSHVSRGGRPRRRSWCCPRRERSAPARPRVRPRRGGHQRLRLLRGDDTGVGLLPVPRGGGGRVRRECHRLHPHQATVRYLARRRRKTRGERPRPPLVT